MKTAYLLSIILAALFQFIGDPPRLMTPTYLPFVSNGECKRTGKPFTDALYLAGSIVVSSQDGFIYRDCVQWFKLSVNSEGERGLTGLATDSKNLWALYADDKGLITVKNLSTGGVLVTLGYAALEHSSGDIAYFNGSLIVAIGDNEQALTSQDDSSYNGKLLSIDPLNGSVKIIAKGLRNAWALSSVNNRLYFVDVGETKFEEINVFTAGANYGWPCFEAYEPRIYAPDVCREVYTYPLFYYSHAWGSAIVGMSFYRGAIVYADIVGDVRGMNGAIVRHYDAISKLTDENLVLTFKDNLSTVNKL